MLSLVKAIEIRKMKYLSVLMGGLALVVVFIMGLSVGVGSQGGLTFTADTLSSWITALATVSIAILTVILARETWALRKIQNQQIDQIRKDAIKPVVSISLSHAPVDFSFMNLHIKNNGAGIAQNISVEFRNLSAYGEEIYNEIQLSLAKLAYLNHGISSLASGEQRMAFALNLVEFNNKFRGRFYEYKAEIKLRYEDLEGTEFVTSTIWDFSELRGVSQVGGDPLHSLAKELKFIREDVHKIVAGQRRLKSDVFDRDDRKAEHEALIESDNRYRAHKETDRSS